MFNQQIFNQFIEMEKRQAATDALAVAMHPYIFGAIKNWESLGLNRKKEFIEGYALAVGGLVNLEFFEQAQEQGIVTRGYHREDEGWFRGGIIGFNTHTDILPHIPLMEVLEIMPHELAHDRQAEITAGKKHVADIFRSAIEEILSHNMANYTSASENYAVYRNQPIERHAFAVGRAFAQAILDYVNAHDLTANPFKEAEARREYEDVIASPNFLQSGRIHIPQPRQGFEHYNPYPHYYQARLLEDRLDDPETKDHNGDMAFYAVHHYALALRYGEYLAPHDPVKALEGLARFAQNNLENDQRAIAPRIQAIAKDYILEATHSQRLCVRQKAQGIIQRLEKYGPFLPRSKAKIVEAAKAKV